jgi:hypothetical protein
MVVTDSGGRPSIGNRANRVIPNNNGKSTLLAQLLLGKKEIAF